MTTAERELREQIAKEISAKFGDTAPYKLVQDFVRKPQ